MTAWLCSGEAAAAHIQGYMAAPPATIVYVDSMNRDNLWG